MISLNDVQKSFGSLRAVQNISFDVGKGEIVGLLGPNGAGKTTIMRILTGYHYPDGGSVYIDGMDIHSRSREIQRRIGYLPEHAALYPELSVREQLEFHAKARISSIRLVRKAMDAAVEICGLENVFHRQLSVLSKGYRQRVGLAQAILHDPEILILDEPTNGLDPNQIKDIRELIRRLGRKKTIILSTHIMQEVEALCNRVLIMNRGEIVAQGDSISIARDLKHSEAYKIRFRNITVALLDELASCGEVKYIRQIDSSSTSPIYEVMMTEEIVQGDEFLFSWAVDRGVMIRELTPVQLSMEDIFARLTQEKI